MKEQIDKEGITSFYHFANTLAKLLRSKDITLELKKTMTDAYYIIDVEMVCNCGKDHCKIKTPFKERAKIPRGEATPNLN